MRTAASGASEGESLMTGLTPSQRVEGDRSAFDIFHPVVALGYFAVALAFGMAAVQPVCLLVSFAGALAYGVVLRGRRAAVRSLVWQLPLVAVIALANPLFSASGSTELFRLGSRAFYLESFAFGACMGLMLATVFALFSNASRVLGPDKVMALFGGVAPTIGLVLSMTARLVPPFVRRGGDIGDVQRACTAARVANADGRAGVRRPRVRENLRLASVLMGWSMEDSLETADAMKARGWASSPRRTTYARYRFRRADAVALACGGALALAAAASAWAACATFSFYPRIVGMAPWWSYLPFALFAALPLMLEAKERLRWKSR